MYLPCVLPLVTCCVSADQHSHKPLVKRSVTAEDLSSVSEDDDPHSIQQTKEEERRSESGERRAVSNRRRGERKGSELWCADQQDSNLQRIEERMEADLKGGNEDEEGSDEAEQDPEDDEGEVEREGEEGNRAHDSDEELFNPSARLEPDETGWNSSGDAGENLHQTSQERAEANGGGPAHLPALCVLLPSMLTFSGVCLHVPLCLSAALRYVAQLRRSIAC